MHLQLFTRVSAKDTTLIKFNVRQLNETVAHALREQLADLINGMGPPELHLDFADVDSMCSTVLALLVSINRKLCRNTGHVVLFNVARPLAELFQLTRLDTI